MGDTGNLGADAAGAGVSAELVHLLGLIGAGAAGFGVCLGRRLQLARLQAFAGREAIRG